MTFYVYKIILINIVNLYKIITYVPIFIHFKSLLNKHRFYLLEKLHAFILVLTFLEIYSKI
jgi:hypothetical protein